MGSLIQFASWKQQNLSVLPTWTAQKVIMSNKHILKNEQTSVIKNENNTSFSRWLKLDVS